MNDYERQRMERIAANNAKMAVSRGSGPCSRLLLPDRYSHNGWQGRQDALGCRPAMQGVSASNFAVGHYLPSGLATPGQLMGSGP